MSRIATSIIQVRNGNVRNYIDGYDAYIYAINKEIDGERDAKVGKSRKSAPDARAPKAKDKSAQQAERKRRKAIQNIERKIAQLDDQKRELNALLLKESDADEALRLHNEVASISSELADAEQKWCDLQEEQESS